jgi:AbrB family looped-hinge helix DNA binding protein
MMKHGTKLFDSENRNIYIVDNLTFLPVMEMNNEFMFRFTKLSTKGQVVIPQEIRERMHLRPGTPFTVEEVKEGILLKKIEVEESWEKVTEPFRRAARETGFTQEDMMNLIEKVRNENRTRQ